jgi:trans-2,3-dihydro-3-hydroxyanthranilate isomerase
MARFAYRLVDVFTRTPFGGNPLAVFSDAKGLDPALMQRIAFELHLSESTFVLPATRPDCDVRVRIFTPRAEIPFAGHPTVGTAFVLDHTPRVTFELGIGPLAVERTSAPDGFVRWRMAQPRPRFGPVLEAGAVAAALGLRAEDLDARLPLEVATTGLPFLMVPLRDLDALGRARLSVERWAGLRGGDTTCPYLFVRTGPASARARMFAGHFGIEEDPATGSAAGPLGGWLVARGALVPDEAGRSPLLVEQGVEMGRPSAIWVEVEGTPAEIRVVHVSGECAEVGGGYFDV